MRRVAVLITLVGLVLLASTAKAHGYSPKDVDRATAIARQAWPNSPCTGQETVTITDTLGYSVIGWAWDGTCTVEVTDTLSPYGLCVILVHEFGHLAGENHTSGVMDQTPEGWAPCEQMLTLKERVADYFATDCKLVKVVLEPASVDGKARVYRCGKQTAVAYLSPGGALNVTTTVTRTSRAAKRPANQRPAHHPKPAQNHGAAAQKTDAPSAA